MLIIGCIFYQNFNITLRSCDLKCVIQYLVSMTHLCLLLWHHCSRFRTFVIKEHYLTYGTMNSRIVWNSSSKILNCLSPKCTWIFKGWFLAKLKKKNLLYTCLFLFIIFLTEEKKAELTQLWSQHNNCSS
jgi:hypothetical protein